MTLVANTDMKYREMIKKRYKEVGNQVAKEQAQMQSDHRQTMDMVNHPPHYNKNGIETIDAIESVTEEIAFSAASSPIPNCLDTKSTASLPVLAAY